VNARRSAAAYDHPTNGTVNVSWPNTYPGWVLDASPTLAENPPPWSEVLPSLYQTNATSIFINTSPSGYATFYQLNKP
jgi:hypothetical protein